MEELKKIKDNLLLDIRRSIRYHNRRRMFFERLHVIFSTFILLSGMTAFTTLLSEMKDGKEYAIYASFIVALFSAVDIVVGTSKKARLYLDLSRRFINLEKSMIINNEISEETINKFHAKRLDIESEEPPVLKVLDSICHNELARSMGSEKKEYVKIRFYQRLFAQLFDLREHTIRRESSAQ